MEPSMEPPDGAIYRDKWWSHLYEGSLWSHLWSLYKKSSMDCCFNSVCAFLRNISNHLQDYTVSQTKVPTDFFQEGQPVSLQGTAKRSHLWIAVLIVYVLSSETLATTYKTTRCHRLRCRQIFSKKDSQFPWRGQPKDVFINLCLICFKAFLLIALDYWRYKKKDLKIFSIFGINIWYILFLLFRLWIFPKI
jgi:hypothetical protein